MSLAIARRIATDGDGERLGDGRASVALGVGEPPLVSVPGDADGDSAGVAVGGGVPEAGPVLGSVVVVSEGAVGAVDGTVAIVGVGSGVADWMAGATVRSGRSTRMTSSPPVPSSA